MWRQKFTETRNINAQTEQALFAHLGVANCQTDWHYINLNTNDIHQSYLDY